LETGLDEDPLDESRSVDRGAACLGGNQPGPFDLMGVELCLADPQRPDRPFHGRFGQPVGGADALTEPDDPREGIDYLEAALAGARDQQPAIVGPEIECGVVQGKSGAGACRAATAAPSPPSLGGRNRLAGATSGRSRQWLAGLA
jgi:hypothetical protein